MSRITKKIENPQYMNDYEQLCNHSYTIINKLGKLEDILQSYNVEDLEELDKLLEMATTCEELSKQLGCPLEVVFKALKQDYIYTKNRRYLGVELGIYGVDWCICCGLRLQIRVADYKKTWWLKENKEE